jgi:sulfoxide reductase catalytic subunit YedY
VISIHPRHRWQLPEAAVTSPAAFYDRRTFLRRLGWTGAGLLGGAHLACSSSDVNIKGPSPPEAAVDGSLYPAPHSSRFVVDRPLTEAAVASTYNNFFGSSVEFVGELRLG